MTFVNGGLALVDGGQGNRNIGLSGDVATPVLTLLATNVKTFKILKTLGNHRAKSHETLVDRGAC